MNPNDPTRKEVYRIFYREKGHVDVSDDTAYGMFNSYFSRQWDTYEGHAAEYWEDGFEEDWEEKLKKEKIL
tara:strand:+ start:306 stop:518 length:213 start_codon:yes stop_codon:yes gene_type:complete